MQQFASKHSRECLGISVEHSGEKYCY